jgi:cytochrome c biogenesis protein CcmG/thiol:disulfide interchange protein DsbE
MARPLTSAFRLLFFLAMLANASSVLANDLRMGKTAPVAVLTTLDGQRISTQDLIGHTVIVTFWATWCEPCRHELPVLTQYATDHRDQGLEILGFALDDEENLARVRSIAKDLGFPVGLLSQSETPGYGRIWHIPVSFVIDRAGLLRYNGWKDSRPVWNKASLDREVTPLLPAAKKPATNAGH